MDDAGERGDNYRSKVLEKVEWEGIQCITGGSWDGSRHSMRNHRGEAESVGTVEEDPV